MSQKLPSESEILKRKAIFKTAFRGINAHHTALIVSEMLTPGIDWRGCGKKRIGEIFAKKSYLGTYYPALDIGQDELNKVVAKWLSTRGQFYKR